MSTPPHLFPRHGPTPSRADGVSEETEFEYRVHGAELVAEAGAALRLPAAGVLTAQALLQRALHRCSLRTLDVPHRACARVGRTRGGHGGSGGGVP